MSSCFNNDHEFPEQICCGEEHTLKSDQPQVLGTTLGMQHLASFIGVLALGLRVLRAVYCAWSLQKACCCFGICSRIYKESFFRRLMMIHGTDVRLDMQLALRNQIILESAPCRLWLVS